MSDQNRTPDEELIINQVWSDGVGPVTAIMGALKMASLVVYELRRIADALEEQTWGGGRR